jgi:hypothetical protein
VRTSQATVPMCEYKTRPHCQAACEDFEQKISTGDGIGKHNKTMIMGYQKDAGRGCRRT